MASETAKLAMELIRIPSVSGNEKQIGMFLAKRLKKNFDVKLQKVGTRFNVLATKGKPKVLLTTHMDTVPGNLKIREDAQWIHGRGACDTKGIISAMIVAAEEAVAQGLSDFGLLFDVSEETDFSGIKKAVNLVNPEFVIVGEPTGLKIAFGQKGIISFKVKCKGKAAHSSMPELGESAIDELIVLLSKLKLLELPDDMELGKTTLNIGMINGGTKPNIIPDNAEAEIVLRISRNSKEVMSIIQTAIPQNNIVELKCIEPIICKDSSFDFLDLQKITVPFFSEMAFWAKKSKVVIFGPGDIRLAHSDDEKIRKKDIEKAKDLFLEIIQKLIENK